jgi:hypothetical protein
MENFDDKKFKILSNKFSVKNLINKGISKHTAYEINKLVLKDINQQEKIKEELNKSLISDNSFSSINVNYFTKFYLERYTEFKTEIREIMLQLIDREDYTFTMQKKELKDSDLYDYFFKIHDKQDVDNIVKVDAENYRSVLVIFDIDDFVTEILPSLPFNNLIIQFQIFKELSANIFDFEALNKVLKKYRNEIKNKEIRLINEGEDDTLIEKIYFYFLKMIRFFLICFYFKKKMNYKHISYAEICYTNLMFTEFIFGKLNTAILLLYLKSRYPSIAIMGNDLFEFQPDPYKDEQIIRLDNYKEKIKDVLVKN